MSVHSGSNWNLAVLVFEERGKPEFPEKSSWCKIIENQQQIQPTYIMLGPGIEPGPHWWELSALTTVRHLLPEEQGLRKNVTNPVLLVNRYWTNDCMPCYWHVIVTLHW